MAFSRLVLNGRRYGFDLYTGLFAHFGEFADMVKAAAYLRVIIVDVAAGTDNAFAVTVSDLHRAFGTALYNADR